MSARVERLVGMATLQGLPTSGLRRFGVPPGGAFDQESYLLAGALVGNDPGAFAIELTNAAIEIAFTLSTSVAITGAPVKVLRGREEAPSNAFFHVAAGQTVSISAPSRGLCVYAAVLGGWIPDGIDSHLARSGRRLETGDVFEHAESLASTTRRLVDAPSTTSPGPLLAIGLKSTLALTVSNASDRTGIRLDGLPPSDVPELVSEPVCVGTIQRTPSGQLIVVGPDGPTIGGYPKIGYVCEAHLDRLAHLRPGQSVVLAPIQREAAREARAHHEARIRRTLSEIAVART